MLSWLCVVGIYHKHAVPLATAHRTEMINLFVQSNACLTAFALDVRLLSQLGLSTFMNSQCRRSFRNVIGATGC